MNKDNQRQDLSHFELNLYYLSNLADHRPGRENKSIGDYEQTISDLCQLASDEKLSNSNPKPSSSLYRLKPVICLPERPVSSISKLRSNLSISYRFPLLHWSACWAKLLKTLVIKSWLVIRNRMEKERISELSTAWRKDSDSLQIRTYS